MPWACDTVLGGASGCFNFAGRASSVAAATGASFLSPLGPQAPKYEDLHVGTRQLLLLI